MTAIRTGDELANYLRKALQIEDGFETVAQWEAYVSTKNPDFQKTIFQLLSESEMHKHMVEEMLSKVKLSDHRLSTPLAPRTFDFTCKEDQEVMGELYQTEILMGNTYKLILNALKGSDMDELIDPADQSFFVNTLEKLIVQEEGHAIIASRYRGNVVRIR